MLAEFELRATQPLFDLERIDSELSFLLGGAKVDLRTPAELSRYFRDEVLRETEDQFLAA